MARYPKPKIVPAAPEVEVEVEVEDDAVVADTLNTLEMAACVLSNAVSDLLLFRQDLIHSRPRENEWGLTPFKDICVVGEPRDTDICFGCTADRVHEVMHELSDLLDLFKPPASDC